MTSSDVPIARELLAQLGYDLELAEVSNRFQAVAESPDHILIVGEQEGRVIAVCHAYARPALEKPPEVVVQSLVVDRDHRGGGTGKAMMPAAEGWAAERGFTSVVLTSQMPRTEAHGFYESIGYSRASSSFLYRKRLSA